MAESGAVQFVFSGIHLMEKSPTTAAFASAARADLMIDLCRRNALISVNRLIGAELDHLYDPSTLMPATVSPDGH